MAACGQPATEQPPSPSNSQRPAKFDPATFPAKFDTEVRKLLRGQLPDSASARIEPTLGGDGRMRPQDYNYTDAWTAWYNLAPNNLLMVILRHDPSANEGDPAGYCRDILAADDAEECSARTLANKTTAITETYRVARHREGFTAPTGEDRPGSLWFLRQVVNRRQSGFGVIAREYVKAASLTEARNSWTISREGLTRVAASPVLKYALPPPPRERCNTTMLMPRTDEEFIRIVCEDSLN